MEGSESEGLSDDFETPKKQASKEDQAETSTKEHAETSTKEHAETSTKEHAETSDKAKKKKVKIIFKCRHCPSVFNVRSNCTRHENTCSFNPDKEASAFLCANCNTSFVRKDNLRTHVSKCQSRKSVPKKKTPCLIKGCGEEFYHKSSLIEHLKNAHNGDINVQPQVSKKFSSIKEFHSWKEAEEERTFSYYTAKKGQAASSTKHFYCQHDGSGKPHSARKSSRCNNKGRVKAGHYCISKMTVRVDDTKAVHLEYYPTHNHKCSKQDFVHHPLPEHVSRYIDEKIAENTPATVVYELAREKFLPRNSPGVVDCKASILTKKRVLERGRRRRMARRLHKDDAKAVYLLVTQLIDSEDESVLVFKPYGSGVVHGSKKIDDLPNSKELFMFGFQTKKQLELFKQHCGKIVILDETHGTNQYKFQLLTAMVVDENRRGWPIAHLITSKSDDMTLQFFFQELKSRLGEECSINCVITDDDPALINGMNLGFSENLKHILCKWHVFKNFKDNIRKKAPNNLFEEILTEVKAILNAESEVLFLKLVSGFEAKYEKIPECSEVLNYFRKYYLKRSEKWAMAYRNFPHSEVNTTGHIESFHSRLKKVYLKRKVNKRLDDLINILYDVAWDDFLTREREAATGFSSQPQNITERHQRSLGMKDETIEEIGLDNTWEVRSATGKSAVYVVVKHKDSCTSDFCFCRCTKPACHGLCAHLFSCSCPDHHPLCKHIHKLQAFLKRGEPCSIVEEPDFYVLPNHKTDQELNNNEEEPLIFEDCFADNSVHDKKWQSMLSRVQSNFAQLDKFIAAVQQKLIPEHTLVHVDAVLSDLVRGFGPLELGVTSEEKLEEIPNMEPAVKFTPNEKLKTQISQLAPFKRPSKRKREPDLAVLAAKKKAAIDGLLAYTQHDNIESGIDDPTELSELEQESKMEDDNTTVVKEARFVNNANSHDDNNNGCFSPSSSYVSDPFDIVLNCGEEKISLIHLKSLELHLTSAEIQTYEKRDPIFKSGWLYSSIIDAFMFKLSQNDVLSLPSELAIRASRKASNAGFLRRRIEEINMKRILLLPGNLTGDHWIILCIMLEDNEIRYYDPLQNPISHQTLLLLQQTVSDCKEVFSKLSSWKIKVVQLTKQADSFNCGAHICHFAKQSVDGAEYSPLTSPEKFRRYMYNLIVGNCLKRSAYHDESCGKCGAQYSDPEDLQIWLCCVNCQQWCHEACVKFYAAGGSGSFTC